MVHKLKEKLHTIPVNDAFDEDSECPLCVMIELLEDNAIDFTMGQSYMEDDVRGNFSPRILVNMQRDCTVIKTD